MRRYPYDRHAGILTSATAGTHTALSSGNQSVSFMQNKTLSNLDETNTKAFLFEKKSKNCYTFLGQVKLHDNYYFEQQSDSEGHIRVVVKFPLEIIE